MSASSRASGDAVFISILVSSARVLTKVRINESTSNGAFAVLTSLLLVYFLPMASGDGVVSAFTLPRSAPTRRVPWQRNPLLET